MKYTIVATPDPRIGCTGKTPFDSPQAATRVMHHLLKRKRRNQRQRVPGPLNAYHCRHCGKWHLGHSTL